MHDLTSAQRDDRFATWRLTAVLAGVCLIVLTLTLTILYRTAFDHQKTRLAEIASSQAQLIEAIAHREQSVSGNDSALVLANTLAQIREAHREFGGIGESGEFTIARETPEGIEFLVDLRYPDQLAADLAANDEPMRRALEGESGLMIGRDYRGEEVVAAFCPIDALGIGIVAKIDAAEIRGPYISSAIVVILCSLICIVIGVRGMRHLSGSFIKAIDRNATQYRTLFEHSKDGLLVINDVIEACNPRAMAIFDLRRERLEGKPLWELPVTTQISPHITSQDIQAHLGQARAGSVQRFEWRFVLHKRQQRVHTEITLTPVELDGKTHVLATVHDITEKKLWENELRNNQEMLSKIFQHANVGIFVIDPISDLIIEANPRALEILGYSRNELDMVRVSTIHPDEMEQLRHFATTARERGMATTDELHCLDKSGNKIPVEISASSIVIDGRPLMLAMVLDVSTQKSMLRQMRQLSSALEQSHAAVMVIGKDLCIDYVNPEFTRRTGLSPDDLENSLIDDLTLDWLPKEDELWQSLGSGREIKRELHGKRPDGRDYWETQTLSAVQDEHGHISHYIVINEDISELKQSLSEIQRLAFYDTLTGLENRQLFKKRLTSAISATQRDERKIALLYIDLDNFKTINDTLGHDAGDQLLHELADRLRHCVREADTVARIGGDEFAVIQYDINHSSDVSRVAIELQESLSKPFVLHGQEHRLSASIGISIAPDDCRDEKTLMKYADIAMYRAKNSGKNDFKFFTHELNDEIERRLDLERRLYDALIEQRFELLYQPIVCLKSGRLIAMESLLRWTHPVEGPISPDQFIPLTEQNGMIIQLGAWVLRTACADAQRLREKYAQDIALAVNISVKQMLHPNFIELVRQILTDTGLPPGALELEITETLLMTNLEQAISVLQELKDSGISVSIDDFGTGYSSLYYLKKLPINTLKVDRSFVMDIPQDSGDMEITAAIISMAASLQLDVIAEGIETEQQLRFLREQGCDYGQGYLFSRPVNIDTISTLLGEQAHQGTIARIANAE